MGEGVKERWVRVEVGWRGWVRRFENVSKRVSESMYQRVCVRGEYVLVSE